METCLLVGRQPRSVSQTVKSIHKSGHRSDRRNALGSKGRNRSLTHRPARETGESSLPSLPGTLWGEANISHRASPWGRLGPRGHHSLRECVPAQSIPGSQKLAPSVGGTRPGSH